MNRREFLASLAAPALSAAEPEGTILVHEHILVDFIGAAKVSPARYNADDVYAAARPALEEIKELGCRRFQECTPNYLGRDPKLLSRLSDATGIEIWTNTGLYASNFYRHLPDFAKRESATLLARRWIKEARDGVDGVKPRFIKIGVNKSPLEELDRKLVQAAAITSRETGLTIASHTGDGPGALEQLDIITAAKVSPAKFVWVHAQGEQDSSFHEKAGTAGAWVEFDGIGPKSANWHRKCLEFMASRNLLDQTLISQDSGWYHAGEPGGGQFNGYAYIYKEFLPQLKPDWVRQLMIENPVKAFGE